MMIRLTAGVVAVALMGLGAGGAHAQSNDMACLPLAEVTPDTIPPKLARAVRDCIAQGRYDDAISVFMAYSSYGLFDQQRVRDESAHAVLVELNIWIFGGYPRDVMDALRQAVARMRDPDSDLYRATCAGLAALGPPDYRPGYLISRGMMPRKTDDDWIVVDFDPDQAWQKAVVEINGCPAV